VFAVIGWQFKGIGRAGNESAITSISGLLWKMVVVVVVNKIGRKEKKNDCEGRKKGKNNL